MVIILDCIQVQNSQTALVDGLSEDGRPRRLPLAALQRLWQPDAQVVLEGHVQDVELHAVHDPQGPVGEVVLIRAPVAHLLTGKHVIVKLQGRTAMDE